MGDRCLVRPGEMVPCDGVIDQGEGDVDLARITGEPIPEHVVQGDEVRSGSVVVARAARSSARQPSRGSRCMRESSNSCGRRREPRRRCSGWPTSGPCGSRRSPCSPARRRTSSRDDTDRLLAVLVVATPCPLILAAPVAIIGGINRIARHRVIVRTGGALERLASIDSVALDKTGTLTVGHPEVHESPPGGGH